MILRYLGTQNDKDIEPQKALVGVLYSQLPMVALGNFVLCAANLVSYSTRANIIALLLFGCSVLFLTSLRLINFRRFNEQQFSKLKIESHYARLIGSSLISGLIWGSWGAYIALNLPFEDALIMLVIQCGICAGTVSTSSASRIGLMAFVIPVLAPLVFIYAQLNSTDGLVLATVTLLYLILVISSAKRSYETLYDSVILAHKNQMLANQLFISSNTDGLTNIANRRSFDAELERLHNQCALEQSQYGVILFDVDWFKSYNDTKGHIAGDECLKQLAKAAQASFPPDCLIARYGGEEFVVLAPNASYEEAEALAQGYRQAVFDLNIDHEAAEPLHRVTISVGVSHCEFPTTCKSCDLVNTADQALYQAKRSGRNKVCSAKQLPQPYDDQT
ncbi:MAG: GGDEF domain-containing protein [Pontibacterium sp.]